MNFELKEMKKNIFKSVLRYVLPLYLFTLLPLTASAQKFALIDMEYILKNVPAYERANEQLNQVSKKWQAEVEALNTEASTMYKNYQKELAFWTKVLTLEVGCLLFLSHNRLLSLPFSGPEKEETRGDYG